MVFRPYPVLTLLTVVSLAILILLGNWQWARFQDKTDLANAGTPEWSVLEPDGVLGPPVYLYAAIEGRSLWRVVYPVSRQDAPAVFAVVAAIEGARPPELSPSARPDPDEPIEGAFTTPARRNALTPPPRPDARAWYHFDAEALAESLGIERPMAPTLFEPATLRILTEGGDTIARPNPYADPRQADRLPPQRHFGYALTWWGLGIALLGVYAAYHKARGRLKFGSGR